MSGAQSQSQNSYLLPGNNMENLRIPELQPVGSVVYQLKAFDKSEPNRKITYALTGDTFSVDEDTGEVKLMKQLDRERQAQISTVVNVLSANSDQPLESRRRVIVVEDVDDSWPIFGSHRSSVINNPQQGQYVYQVEVSEQAPISSIVLGELLVTDADEGPNAEIVFECRARQSTSGACEAFSVDSRRLQSGKYSVTIRTKMQLDFERIQSHKLSIGARGKRPSPLKGMPLEAEAIVNINLLNVQDEGPLFVNAPYALSMHEGLKSGTRLLTLVVQDGDLAPQRDLSMIVVDGPYKEYFQVTKDPELSKIWYLETNQTIDREAAPFSQLSGNMFQISLLAAELDDSGSPVASEPELLQAMRDNQHYAKTTLRRESVTILVLDLPDSRPVFVHSNSATPIENNFLVVNVSESILTGASIPNLDLAVMDLDEGINSRFRLSLVDAEIGPQASSALALESEIIHGRSEVVLNVLNSSLLDYEKPELRTYRFSLVASKAQQPLGAVNSEQLGQLMNPLVNMLEVQMNILDSNDNWPEFEREQYIVSVPEGSLPGHVVATIKAKDLDSGQNGRVDYMLRGSGASKFKLVSSEGKILVNDCGVPQCLDHETQPSFSLTYEARDGGGQTRNVSIIINVSDINDHAPKFTESVYKRELISDNLSSKQNYISPQLIVRARDEDGPSQGRHNVTYRIKSSNLTGLDVDPSSGLVYISQPLDLDAIIESGAGLQRGAANQESAEVRPQQYPADRKVVFEAEVVAEDNGNPPLNSSALILLTVKGNRDGAPQFRQDSYLAYVRENQPPSKAFFQVQAIDPDDKDSQLRYSLGYDQNGLVQVDARTGELSFKSQIDYDDFQGKPYNVTVYATDNARPYPLRASTMVSILVQDVNDKRPKFELNEYKATLIQGKTQTGDSILQVNAIDSDKNHLLNYSIISDSMALTDRNGQQFTLDDIANATSGYMSQISRVERNQLVHSLLGLFSINKRTGSIELRAEPDYSLAASISFQVRVVDLNQEVFTSSGEIQQDTTQCNLFLQTHIDKNPIFAPPWSVAQRRYNLSILEELPIDTHIFSLFAKDPQTNQRIELFEKVFDSDPRDYFRVDRSGLILINRRIDFEELKSKTLTLSVKALTSEAQYSVADLYIQVVDLNDNSPQFKNHSYHVSVSESLQPNQELLTVHAEDRDSEEFGQVFYSLSGYQSHLFEISQRKGVITLRRGAKLDRDTESSYYLIAVASDCNETVQSNKQMDIFGAGHFNLASLQEGHHSQQHLTANCKRSSVPVEITVLDENDNDPVFMNVNKRGEYEAYVSETVSVGSVITQVQARDIDEGPNGQVAYEIVKGDDLMNQLFKVDSDGFVSVQSSLSGLGRSTPYRVSLRAFDQGTKLSRQAYVNLLVTIHDVVSNDGVPRFIRPKQDEIILLSESAGPGTFVYQVQAVDPDEDASGKLMYKFIQPSDTFDIDPFEGVIKTQNRPNFYLDREQVPNYTLIVVAQDFGNPPKQTHQILNVKIVDVNDNEPYFEREIDDPPLVIYVQEEVPRDTLIGTIQAIDKDEGPNAQIGYEIIEGNQNNLFRLSWFNEDNAGSKSTGAQQLESNNACKIYSTGRLDRETKGSHTLTIRASSISRVRNQVIPVHLRDPLAGRNPFNQYNASDLTKIRVTIKLVDINDNRPTFLEQNPKTIVESSAEVYSQLMVIKAYDVDASSFPIQYSILDALYFTDNKFNVIANKGSVNDKYHDNQYSSEGASMRHVFDIDSNLGILRNSVALRPYTDGYFEVFIKADSGQRQGEFQAHHKANDPESRLLGHSIDKCQTNSSSSTNETAANLPPGSDTKENCSVAVTKAIVFVTHQRETFKFVFNKTKLNDRLDEFKEKIQQALESIMFEPVQAQASYGGSDGSLRQNGPGSQDYMPRAERVILNTFQTDFYEREDGSMDFSTITSCSQLVKFDDRANINSDPKAGLPSGYGLGPSYSSQFVPNQVMNFEEVLNLLKSLNKTQSQQQQTSPMKQSLFNQYGLVKIERCLPDKTMYKMTLSERLALYMAAMMALVSVLLAFIVSRVRKNYEKNLKVLQRSKYHYNMATAASPFGA